MTRGDRVACLSRQAADAMVLLLAAQKLGAVGKPLKRILREPYWKAAGRQVS